MLAWIQVLLYAKKDEVEPDAIKQLVHLAESALPVKALVLTLSCLLFTALNTDSTVVPLQSGYVSAMPDVHLGKGVTVSPCSPIRCCSCQNFTFSTGLILSGVCKQLLY